ncbi:MAG TPA: PqqD family protein [Acidimicrobiia bacterium]|nr:PqqD family protein [Acidimicrobiia bacterium]
MGGRSQRVGPPAPQVVETEVDGDVCLYDPTSERVAVLNATASDVWRLADGTFTISEISELLASSYGTQPTSIAPDVEAVVSEFIEAGFLAQE